MTGAHVVQGTDPGPEPQQPAVVATPNGGAHITLAPPSGRG